MKTTYQRMMSDLCLPDASKAAIRARLAEMGWTVTDTAQGPKVSKA